MTFLENKRGTPRLQCNGYFYRINCRSSKGINWSCDLRSRLKCKATASTVPEFPNYARITNNLHNHTHRDYTNLEKLVQMD